MREKVLTEQWLITPTVEAVAAQFSIVTDHSLAHLHALYASVLSELGETRNAQQELQEAELLDSSLEIVQAVRSSLHEKTKKR
ncbi:MAG: hypothetical protein NVS9B9_24120 [Ktedonobacteraceae bacterium]